MANAHLTDRKIKNAESKEKEYLLADGNGLFLRVRPDGSKYWLLIYTFNDKRRKLGLGALAVMSLKLARERAQQAREELACQVDPQLAKKERETSQEAQRQTLAARISVRDLFDRWEKVDLIRRKDGGKEIRRMFDKDVLKILGDLAVEDVRKGHITKVTDALLARGVNRMAKLIFSLMRQMFRFAVDRDIIESDPSASIRKAKIGGKATERERVLSAEEIRELARKLPEANLLKTTECAIWIMLSTLCRVGEIIKAKWEHLDLEAGTWLIPAENSKNVKPHFIKLSDFSVQQFRQLASLKESDQWIFPNRAGTDHVCDKTITIQIKGRQTEKVHTNRTQANTALMLPGGNWTPHDLRRTGATMMTALGVLPEIAERCLNHTEENKMKRIYQRHSYDTEKRDAWRLLGERLELLLRDDADNVIFLGRNAA